MSQRIVNHSLENYDGTCLLHLEDALREAQNLAQENYMNQFGDGDKEDIAHLERCEKQLHILYNMYKKAKMLDTIPITAGKISML